MSHLGDLLSALIDGELSGTELDRANAHLAACGHCRLEASALRRLKHDLRGLSAEMTDADQFTARLLAMTGPAEPGRLSARRAGGQRRHGATKAYQAPPFARRTGRRRVRYVLWSALSLVVVGVGGAAFGMGGGSPSGPRITPQLEVFDLQHAITSGDIPFSEPAMMKARVPVGAATP